jgi:TIR domain
MRTFLSYASEDRALAEEIQLALLGSGHHVFFDKASLPAGGDYHREFKALSEAPIFIFLITPNSVAQGSYALTELKYACGKWAHPKEKLLPVLVRATAWNAIPAYLKPVTVLEPERNVAAEVLTAVESMNKYHAQPDKSRRLLPPHDHSPDYEASERKTGANYTIQIWVAVIGLAGVWVEPLLKTGRVSSERIQSHLLK